MIAQYMGNPGKFPADTPLKAKPASGTKVAQLVFGTPVGGLIAQLLTRAGQAAGVQMEAVKAGTTPSTVQAAANTLIALHPKAVLLPASDPNVFPQQLQTMKQDGIHVASDGVMNPRNFGVESSIWDQRQNVTFGRIMANWVVATQGKGANVVFFGTPELSFSSIMQSAFTSEFAKNCPGCSVDYQKLSAAAAGSTAPATVVAYLQSHPTVNTIVYASIEENIGVPSAVKAAGLRNVKIVGFGDDPVNLQYLKSGQIAAMLCVDIPVDTWATLDMALRQDAGQPLSPMEQAGMGPAQLLLPKDVTFNPGNGWTGYPDFPARFAKLWGGR